MGISKRDRNRIERRARILESARSLFVSQDFDEVSMSDVARAAGVARATVFNYFASKYALLDAITRDVVDDYAAMLERAHADEATSTPTLLRAFAEHVGQKIEQAQQLYGGLLREMAEIRVGLGEGGATAYARELLVGRVAGLMARGQARGEISGDHTAADLAHAFDSLAYGTIVRWLYDDLSKSLPERMGRAIDIFLGGIAEGPAAARSDDRLPVLGEPDGSGP